MLRKTVWRSRVFQTKWSFDTQKYDNIQYIHIWFQFWLNLYSCITNSRPQENRRFSEIYSAFKVCNEGFTKRKNYSTWSKSAFSAKSELFSDSTNIFTSSTTTIERDNFRIVWTWNYSLYLRHKTTAEKYGAPTHASHDTRVLSIEIFGENWIRKYSLKKVAR